MAEKFLEVRRLLDEYKPKVFYFLTEEQESIDCTDPGAGKLYFDRLQLGKYPDYIYLSNGRSYIRFDFIDTVSVDIHPTTRRASIHVFCGGGKTPAARREYIVTAELPEIAS